MTVPIKYCNFLHVLISIRVIGFRFYNSSHVMGNRGTVLG